MVAQARIVFTRTTIKFPVLLWILWLMYFTNLVCVWLVVRLCVCRGLFTSRLWHWLSNLNRLFIWEPKKDKKRDGTIFIPFSYVDFFNRDEINRHYEIISVVVFWAWNNTVDSINKTALPNSIFKGTLMQIWKSSYMFLFI